MKLRFLFITIGIFTILACHGEYIDYKHYKKAYPNSDYVILDKKISISYFKDPTSNALKAKSRHSITILTLTDDCYEIDLIQIPFSMFEEVKIKSARYFKLDSLNEKQLIENIKVKYAEIKNYYINGIFYSDLKVKQFAPTVSIGKKTLLTYTYEIIYHDVRFLTSFFIQHHYDNVENFQFSIRIPEYVNAEVKLFNKELKYFQVKEEKTSEEKRITYKINNLKEPETFQLSPPSNYYLPHFVVLTKSYSIKGKLINVLNSTSDQYAWYHKLISQLKPDKELLKTVSDKITQGKINNIEKIEAIFKWVQDNIVYVAFEDGIAGFKPEESHKVYKFRYGDCKGMANLLVDLLKSESLEAHQTWVGTRHINYDYSMPSLIVDNHMICTVVLSGKLYFLDPTNKVTSWNQIPYYLQGKQALIEMGDTYKLVTIPIAASNKNNLELNIVAKIANERINVNGDFLATGDNYDRIISLNRNLSNIYKPYFDILLLKRFLNNIQLTNAKKNKEELDIREIGFSFTGYCDGNLVKDNNTLYLFCDFDRKYYCLFVEKENGTPVFFNNKTRFKTEMRFQIPGNSKFRKIPENITYKSSDDPISFDIQYKVEGNYLIYSKIIIVNDLLIEKFRLSDWNGFVTVLSKAYNSPVIIDIK